MDLNESQSNIYSITHCQDKIACGATRSFQLVPLPDLDPIQSFGISIQIYNHTWSFQLVPFILIYFLQATPPRASKSDVTGVYFSVINCDCIIFHTILKKKIYIYIMLEILFLLIYQVDKIKNKTWNFEKQ